MAITRPPLPPFTLETAIQKVRAAEDKDDFGIYAVYPRESGMRAHQSLDYVPSRAGSATNPTASTIPIQDTLEIPDAPGILLPEG